jgi:hypothetical protein
MTRKIILKLFFWAGLIALGLFIIFRYTWAPYPDSIIGIPAFIFILFGGLFFSINLSKLLIPLFPEIDSWALMSKESFTDYRKLHGNKFRYFYWLYVSIWMAVIISCGYFYFTSVRSEEQQQIKDSGTLQMVRIDHVHYMRGNGRQVEFDYYFNGRKYSSHLGSETINEGDSVMIIFSSEDPDIVHWPGNIER